MLIDEKVIRKTAARCRERGVVLPAFAELRNPEKIPAAIREKLCGSGMDERQASNLFRLG